HELRDVKKTNSCDNSIKRSLSLSINKTLEKELSSRFAENKNGQSRIEAFTHLNKKEKSTYLHSALREYQITSDVKTIATNHKGYCYGLDFRLKSADSLYEKAYLREDTISVTSMKDIVRYTLIYNDDVFTEGVKSTICDFEDMGYELLKLKNTFTLEEPEYKSINTTFKSYNGQKFEVQFLTPDGIKIKMASLHPLYEKLRMIKDKNCTEAVNLHAQMVSISSKIKNPKGIEQIRNR
uniref:hypothetical protein n=1 Tax=Holdemanella sp. TaxID=1971762 RepID=UPI003AF03015